MPDPDNKPLGAYRCGGRCSPEGWIGGGYQDERTACPKCRVFRVSADKRMSHLHSYVLVRARTGKEAVEIASKQSPYAKEFTVSRENAAGYHAYDFARTEAGALVRKLRRGTPEQCESRLMWRTRSLMTVATRDWKLPPERVATLVRHEVEQFMKKHGLTWKKTEEK